MDSWGADSGHVTVRCSVTACSDRRHRQDSFVSSASIVSQSLVVAICCLNMRDKDARRTGRRRLVDYENSPQSAGSVANGWYFQLVIEILMYIIFYRFARKIRSFYVLIFHLRVYPDMN